MFGWEFPPNISGGLGTACLGLTTSLIKQNVDVIFVVPKLFGDEEKNQLRFINATNIKINIEDPYYLRLIERLNYIEVDSEIAPYLSPKEYSLKSINNLEEFTIKKKSSCVRAGSNFTTAKESTRECVDCYPRKSSPGFTYLPSLL